MLVRTIINDNDSGSRSWIFGHGLASYKKEQEGVKQRIKSALLEFKYDCYFALTRGINWRVRLGYTQQKQVLDEDIYAVINNNDAVVDISNFRSNIIDRNYSLRCAIYTIYSTTPIEFYFAQNI